MVALGACRLCVHSRAQGAHLESEKSGGRRGEAAGWRWASLQCLRRRRNGEAVVRATGGRLLCRPSLQHLYNNSTAFLTHACFSILGGPAGCGGRWGNRPRLARAGGPHDACERHAEADLIFNPPTILFRESSVSARLLFLGISLPVSAQGAR